MTSDGSKSYYVVKTENLKTHKVSTKAFVGPASKYPISSKTRFVNKIEDIKTLKKLPGYERLHNSKH